MAEFLVKEVTSEQEWDQVSVSVKQCVVHKTGPAGLIVKFRIRRKLFPSSRISAFTTLSFSLNVSS